MWLIGLIQKLWSVPYLMRHPGVPRRLKVLPLLALAYLIFPRDLIIDLRWLGLFDDILVIGLLLGIFVSKAQRYVLDYERRRQDSIDADFKVLVEEEHAKAQGEDPRAQKRTKTKARPAPRDHTPKDDLRSL